MSQSPASTCTWCDEWTINGALTLDGGGTLEPVVMAYETWGVLSPSRDNVVLLCHALTGNSHACDRERPDDARAGWWNLLIGPGRVFDTDRFFVLCANVVVSHREWSPAQLRRAGITQGIVRVSVGIEDSDDIVHDIEQALETLPSRSVADGSLREEYLP